MPTILHTLFLKNERTSNKVSYTQKEKNQSTQMAYGFCDDDGGASIQDIALAAQKQRTQMADGGGVLWCGCSSGTNAGVERQLKTLLSRASIGGQLHFQIRNSQLPAALQKHVHSDEDEDEDGDGDFGDDGDECGGGRVFPVLAR